MDMHISFFAFLWRNKMNKSLEDEINQLHADFCSALAEPKRLLILYSLAESPKHVTELAEALGASQPAVSRHLKILRENGMVSATRSGLAVSYSLVDARVIEALDLLRAAMRDQITRRAAVMEAVEG
jgi:ArsR family transcriptional regulator, virulence genes transcriptional regulator